MPVTRSAASSVSSKPGSGKPPVPGQNTPKPNLAMNYATTEPLPDIQKTPDVRGVAIDQVGICDLSFPITVLDRQNQKQQASARIAMFVSLPHHFKGTHMSRFLEIL